jgi:hypothetical protein
MTSTKWCVILAPVVLLTVEAVFHTPTVDRRFNLWAAERDSRLVASKSLAGQIGKTAGDWKELPHFGPETRPTREIVLMFIGSCATCSEKYVREVQRFRSQPDSPEVLFVATDKVDRTRSFAERVQMPVLLDDEHKMAFRLDASTYPALFLLDSTGQILATTEAKELFTDSLQRFKTITQSRTRSAEAQNDSPR